MTQNFVGDLGVGFLPLMCTLAGAVVVHYLLKRNPRQVEIRELWVYPIKSCKGIRVASAEIGRHGFVDDRQWMLVNSAGRFQSQRELPRLALITVAYTDDKRQLHVTAPEMPDLLIDRAPVDKLAATIDVTVWDDKMQAVPIDDRGWFAKFLSADVRLVRVSAERHSRPAAALDYRGVDADGETGFADGQPFLMLSIESLAALREHLPADQKDVADVRRFRPNIVVAGCVARNEEDSFGRMLVGDRQLELYGLRECTRCRITTNSPTQAVYGEEPLSTLRRYRAPLKSDGSCDITPVFGVNVSHKWRGATGALVNVGDKIVVVERRKPLDLAEELPPRA